MKKLLLLLTALVDIGIVSLNREALASPGPTAEPTEQAMLEDALPDSELTPGDAFANVAVTDLEQPGYSKHVRHVTEETRRQVLAEYEIAWEQRNEYEVDHLVPLSIGGSNSIRNLWPEPLRLNVGGKDMGAVVKDALEEKLRWLVVSGQIDLQRAQREIAEDWITAYRHYIGEFPAYVYDSLSHYRSGL